MREPHHQGDPLLAHLVRSWNATTEPTTGPSLILHLGGTLLTGRLLPDWRWAAEEADGLRAVAARGVRDADTSPSADGLPTVIHLADARTLLPSGVLHPNRGTRWRGLLSHVDGWSFGTIEVGLSNRADEPPRVW